MRSLPALILLALAVGCASSRSPAQPAARDLQDTLPFDPAVRTATLPNGLTYYVEANRAPQKRAELRLVVRAGSIHEDDDQLGLAHVVEHMAFNGTASFSGNELIAYLESLGVRFGAHLNAYTSFDETVYMLQVPTDDPAVLEKGLSVLSDWASGIVFDEKEIEKERGVVLEEWRRSLGAGGRLRDKMIPLTFKNSRYKDRLPIGTEESLKTFDREKLVRFYRDWYRPDLMAVIAVGDFDPKAIEARIVETFGPLKAPENSLARDYAPVPSDHPTLFGIFTDPEVPQSSFQILVKVDDREEETYAYYRQSLVEQIALGVLNERLGEVAREPGAPILGAGAQSQRLSPIKGGYAVGAAVKEGRLNEAFALVLTEVRRFNELGVGDNELERSRRRISASFDSYFNEREKTHSRVHAAELVRVFTTGEAAPGVENEVRIARELLGTITVDDVKAFTKRWFPEKGRVINVILPRKPDVQVPTEEELAAVIARVEGTALEARNDALTSRPLIPNPPAPGQIVERRRFEEEGIDEWTLSNGMRVLIKATDFKKDQILAQAFSFGGTMTVDDVQYPSARAATAVATQSGIGEFDAVELRKLLAGRRVAVRPQVGENTESIRASSSNVDLETMLQLMHLQFTEPRLDERGLAIFRDNTRETIRNRLQTPGAWFRDEYRRLMWRGYLRYEPWSEVTLDAVDLKSAEAFMRARFANAADFTVVLVGSVDKEKLEPLVARYLASLPGDPTAREPAPTNGPKRSPGTQASVVKRGIEQKAQVQYTLHGDFEPTRSNRLLLSAVGEILSSRLREQLREELGGTYSVSAAPSVRRYPTPTWSISISFGCDPGRVDELTARMKSIVESMRREPPTIEEMQKLIAQQRRSRETAIETNGFWLQGIVAARTNDEPFSDLLEFDSLIDALDASVVHEAAKLMLSTDRIVEVVLVPEHMRPGPTTSR
ncbi:MAG: insulinase family protein [Myxococcota bacterium]